MLWQINKKGDCHSPLYQLHTHRATAAQIDYLILCHPKLTPLETDFEKAGFNRRLIVSENLRGGKPGC